MTNLKFAAVLSVLAAPAMAQGDASAGENQFNRQCVACHVVQNDAGEVLAGRNAKVGPNLYGIVGRTLGSVPQFRYGDSIVALGETGEAWNEENFVAYAQDPTGWLREKLSDRRARSMMAYQVRSETEARDIYAYLATFSQ